MNLLVTGLSGLVLLVAIGQSSGSDAPQVQTKFGAVYGKKFSYNGMSLYGYVGIPFAKPPVGERRFKKPEAPVSWKGIYRPNHWPKTCHPHNEDCLYLNVFVPVDLEASAKLPTVVWIHGGAFEYGTGNRLRPHYFLRNKNMVFVTVEYRLSVLGFLYAGNDEAPGNMGLCDQQMALRWVKDNIEKFGGDSNRITMVGFSAGSASINYHMTSPMSRGLFGKAILVSGAVTSSFAYNPVNVMKNYFGRIVKYFNCTTASNEESVRCLRKYPADVIAQGDRALPHGMGLHPTVDGKFVTGPPSSVITNNAPIPILAIANQDEGVGWARRFFRPSLTTPKMVRDKMASMFDDTDEAIRHQIIEKYFDDEAMSSLVGARRASANVMSDMINLCPIRNMATIQAESASPVYQIIYSHYHEKSDDFWSEGQSYVNHIAIHPFIFGDVMYNPDYSAEEKKMGERINRLLTNFIISSNISRDDIAMNEASVNNDKYIEVSLKEDKVKDGWPREQICTKIWNELKKMDDDVPMFMFTDNLIELRRRLQRQDLMKLYYS